MLTNAELAVLFADLESDQVERKRSAADRSGIRKSICAFANDFPNHGKPGVIFIGVENDGSCANTTINDELLRTLAQMRGDGNILPPPVMTVQKKLIQGCELALITVEPSLNPPVRYQSTVWIKVGPTVRRASAEEEQRLSEKRRASDLPFDMRPVAAVGIADLDLDFFQRTYLPSAVAADVIEQNQRSLEQQLESLRFLTKGLPNYGALLVFGRDPLQWLPGAYVQFLRIDGTQLTDPIRDQKQLSGPLCQMLARLDELLDINISTATDLISAPREIRRPDYPIVALQQLVRNAVMHRSYDGTNAPVRLYWFVDRIEISNPGGLYGQVNELNFGKGATDYRNPLLAEALRTLGYVQRFGIGIPLAREALQKNGNPEPQFEFQPTQTLVIVRRRP